MEENDNKQKQKPNGEIDHFSRFLFGNSTHRETYKERENNSQEQNKHSSSRSNRIDEWFFGSRRKEPENSALSTQNQIENLLNNVDFELLMETIDILVDTSKQFKPVIKEITPFFNKFIKKFKSN